MSTILKALRRLEREREEPARDLRHQVVATPRPHEPRPRWPLLMAAGAAGAVLVVAGFQWMDGRWGADTATEAASLTPPAAVERRGLAGSPLPMRRDGSGPSRPAIARRPATASAAPSRPAPSAARAPRTVPEAAPRAPTPALRPRIAPAPAVEASAPAPVSTAPEPAPAVTARLAAPEAAPVETARLAAPEAAPVETARLAAPEPAPPAIEAVSAVDPPESGPAAPGIVGATEVAERLPLPRIVVERTLWHPSPGRRLAFLRVEGREGTVQLREGDVVGDAVVQQIDPSAVLFEHRGVEIRRRVGARD